MATAAALQVEDGRCNSPDKICGYNAVEPYNNLVSLGAKYYPQLHSQQPKGGAGRRMLLTGGPACSYAFQTANACCLSNNEGRGR